jgi:hypothetical protein
MRARFVLIAVVVALAGALVAPVVVRAQERHVATDAVIASALHTKAANDASNREAILKVFKRDEVRQLASRLGLEIKDAESAIAHASGAELAEAAARARAIDRALAGGDTKVSLTTLLLIIIIVILIVD